MVRIGILGINDLAELFLGELFRLDPGAHVFLSAGDAERANRLARKFPCWLQDNGQAVINEADTILIAGDVNRSGKPQEKLAYRQTQLVLCLDVRQSFNKPGSTSQTDKEINVINRQVTLQNLSPYVLLTDAQADDYLFVLRALLISMKPIHSLDVNIQSSSLSTTA